MRTRVVSGGVRAALLGLCAGTAAPAAVADGTLPDALEALRQAYPGVEAYQHGGQVRAIYGRAMTGAATPDAAAGAWVAQHSGAFGVGALDLRLEWTADLNFGRSTVFTYRQYLNNLPVEQGFAKVLVANGATDHVVYAAGRLARAPEGGFGDAAVTGPGAVARVQASSAYADLGNWSAPQMVVYYGEGDIDGGIAPVVAWKFSGSAPSIASQRAFTFFVDAATGALVFARSDIYHTDVSGTIQGMATTGLKPIGVNPSALTPLPDARATVQGGSNAFTNALGAFTVPHAGSSPVTVNSNLQGRWVNVIDAVGAEITASQAGVTPPGPANLVFNSPEVALNTAQVNGFLHTVRTHNFFKERAPSFNGLDMVITCNVNLTQTCNAFYQSSNQSINFFQAGGGCANTSYSTVISHEYGHFVVNRLGLGQGAFGEGYGDSIGMLLYDTPIVGENFQGSSPVRSPGIIVQAYPCSQAIHTCGQVLGGVWYRIRQNLGNAHGSQVGLLEAQQMFVDWSLITAGGLGSDSAHPQTAIEVMTVDDDDNNLANGTPNYSSICAAFGTHSIACPQVVLLAFSYPNGRPTTIVEGQPTQIRVDVTGVSASPIPNTGRILYRVNGGGYTSLGMIQGAPNQYTATLPAMPCPAAVDYYFEAQSSAGLARDPVTAPTTAFVTGIPLVPGQALAESTFEGTSNAGWVSGFTGDNAATGRWNRMDPAATTYQGQNVQPGDDHTPAPGVNCWVTDGNAGTTVGDFDVDNGRTTLVSPVFNLQGASDDRISYWRWYSNGSNGAQDDTFRVEITSNGTSWVRVETVGPTGAGTTGGWIFKEFRAGAFVPLTEKVQVRFVAEDILAGSLVEAAIDDFKVAEQVCPQGCYADCDTGTGPGVLDIFDFLCFQNAFAAGAPFACNCDVSTGQNVCDVFDFLCFQNEFAGGCP